MHCLMIIYALLEPHVTILEWKATQLKFPWNVTILLGSGFALAQACEVRLYSFWKSTPNCSHKISYCT